MFGQEMPRQPMFGRKRDVVILIVLQVALGLAYLRTVPRIYIDEVWDSSLGYGLAHTGTLKHPFIEGFGGVHIHFVQNRVVLPLVCAAVFKVAGYSIVTSRIGSLLFGVLAVVSLYAVTRRWFGEKQAIWITVATILHPWFFNVSRRARPEIYYIALALTLLWSMVRFFDSRSRRIAFFTGVLAGLSALTHPNGLTLVFSISCAVMLWFRTKSIGRLIQWASAGFVVVILPYIIYVFWAIQDPQVSFAGQMQINMLHRLPLYSEILRWKSFLQWPKGAPLAVIMFVSWVVGWYRSSAADKTLATVIAVFALILHFASVHPTSRYLAATTPFFSALMVRLIWRIMAAGGIIWQNWYKSRFAISASIVVIYLSTCVAAIGLMFYHLRGADFTRVIDRVASVVGPESRVYGDPIFWVGHQRYQYGPYLITYERILLTKAIDMVRKHSFDYAVRTAWLLAPPMGYAEPPRSMPDFRNDCLGDHVCRIFGTKIDEFHDPYYGPIEIYELNWDNNSSSGNKK
jgi:hypothetical protein